MIDGQHAPDHRLLQISAHVATVDDALVWVAQHLPEFTGNPSVSWQPVEHTDFGHCVIVVAAGHPAAAAPVMAEVMPGG